MGGITMARALRPFSAAAAVPATAVLDWSNEARRAIVPPGPAGVFGPENYGNKFPGEAAVYMGIVHAAIYDAVLAIEGGYEAYAIKLTSANGTSAAAAVSTAAHDVLIGLQPALGLTAAQQEMLDSRYATYLAAIADGPAKANGIAVGKDVAAAMLALRANDGRERNPDITDLKPPPPGPGIWEDGGTPALGLRLPAFRPLALESSSQFRPDGPNPMGGGAYRDDFREVERLGGADSTARKPDQTVQALFWTDHDVRQWNDGMLALAAARRLDGMETARMLAMAHAAGGDAMIACFDAKYHVLVLAAVPGDCTSRHRQQRRDRRRPRLAAAARHPELPRVPVGARLPHHGGGGGARVVLRHQQGLVLAR